MRLSNLLYIIFIKNKIGMNLAEIPFNKKKKIDYFLKSFVRLKT